jgi:hypothetical protein
MTAIRAAYRLMLYNFSNILISHDGKIIAKNLQGVTLDKKLADILK